MAAGMRRQRGGRSGRLAAAARCRTPVAGTADAPQRVAGGASRGGRGRPAALPAAVRRILADAAH
ncbi:conserved hypothetical protein [Ricinus communis]|uniref:Uncharacterized protein n=1 Tax=Ricinus communis TaxID=3988 RepID=B9TNZ2_RICCO|nr:conserved hypothetical protein [Ricinus communis]